MGTATAQIDLRLNASGIPSNLQTSLETGTAWALTKALALGEHAFSMFIQRVLFSISDVAISPFLVLEIYGSDMEEGPFELLDTLNLSEEDPGYSDPPGQRYYKFRFFDSAAQARWSLGGFTIYGEPGGEEF